MKTAKMGNTLALSYVCYDEDGTELENSGGVFEIVLGEQAILPKLESAVVGMRAGETKRVVLDVKDAFGERNEDDCDYIPLDVFTSDIRDGLEEGEMVELAPDDGSEPMHGIIREIYEDEVLVDYNHPMAGKRLTFDITLVEIM